MKPLFGLLFFIPLTLFAKDTFQDKTFTELQQLCLQAKTVEERDKFCQLAKKHLEAMEMVKQMNPKTTN